MADFKYCTGCLVSEVNMYSLNASHSANFIREVYSQLMQITVYNNEYVCYECAWLLHKYQQFKLKCHRAQDILANIKANHLKVTKKHIQNVDRNHYKLISNITFTPVTTYDTDASISIGENNTDGIKSEVEFESCVGIVDVIKSEVLIEDKEEDNLETEYDVSNDDMIHQISNNYSTDSNHSHKMCIIKKQKHKDKIAKKVPQTKKRKLKIDSKCSSIIVEDQEEHKSVSDDEPLSNKVSNSTKTETNGTDREKYPKNFNVSHFEDYATVVFLTPEEAKKEVLLRKESSNYMNSPYKCELCYRGYEALAAFENHMKKHSIEYGKHKCELCHLRFPEQRFLCKHRLACHKRKFHCKICPYVCFCTHQAKTHVNLHKGKKYPCEDCGEIFSMPNSLLMHKRLKHLTECVCELCGNTFATPRGLYSHNMKVHRQDKNDREGPKCDECNIHFASEEAWKRHMVLSSKHKVSNGCKWCGETFPNSEDLKSHMRVHSRRRVNRGDYMRLPAACTICDKWLSNRGEYKSHMTSEHPLSEFAKKLDADDQTPFVCEVCGQMFKKQCFLTYHQRKHTGERPYKCHECGKTFQLAGALSIHTTIHTKKRVHKCDMCGRVFTFKSALNKHMKVHLGIRPHKCNICEKSFISPCDVKLHIKYVHNKVPWPKRDRSKRNANEHTTLLHYN